MEYILALLLTSSVIFISYRVGKRAGIKEEQLRVANEKNKQWEDYMRVINSNNDISDDDVNTWLYSQKQ